ncbi:hypothetical protein LOD99_1980 [Oopsacas minuta]|uniref:Uncharacterized protein n=1 Tax=Oopsacas minuta TaxID=111878 RepID=A0AAV7K5A3_9METZ|nr:hypothetical protein LOD99_1980 [Oopsacas minuta]
MVNILRYFLLFALFLLPLEISGDYLIYPGSLTLLNLTCDPNSTPSNNLSGTPCLVTAGDTVQLSVSITAAHVRNMSSEGFRAHPLLISCLQRFSSKLSAMPQILQFYLSQQEALALPTNDSAINTELLDYHRAGLAVSFSFKNVSFNTLLQNTVTSCVDKFAAEQFTVGLIQLSDDTLDLQLRTGFKFYPGGINDTYFSLVDNSLIPATLPNCPSNAFLINSTYPVSNSRPEQVVGQVYQPVNRSSEQFLNLLQYPDTKVMFSGCPNIITGYSIQQRCATRVMSFRLYRTFKVLAGLLGNLRSGLSVVRSWSTDPFNITNPLCYSSPLNTSLFSEGRALVMRALEGFSMDYLALLSQCAGFDYVYYGCDYVLVAVRNQRSTPPLTVVFPESVLLPVTLYGAAISLYPLSPSISEYSPLFDSDGIRDKMLSKFYTVNQLAGPDRYFRIHPVLVQCIQLVTESLTAYLSSYSIRIQQAYSRSLSSQLEDYTTGLAVKLSIYPTDYPLLNFTLLTIRSCALYVSQQHNTLRRLHLGLLPNNSLYLAIATEFTAWSQIEFLSPYNSTFYGWANTRYNAALSGTLVNPANKTVSCANTILSSPPSPDYVSPYTLPSVITYLTSVQPNNCVSQSDTEFCSESQSFRDNAIAELLVIMRRKHWLVSSADLVNTLTQCFGLCATCMEGDVWYQKLAYCDNLVHWVPFRLISEADNMHFYVMENMTVKEYACSGSRLCIAKSPIYAVLAYTVETLFRPDPAKSQELSLYSMADNPIPVYTLLDTIYALYGAGNITVWVTNENDLLVLKPVLRVLMLDNVLVTCVDIRLFDSSRLTAVQRQLDGNIHEWTTNGCPTYSRDVIAPYTISIVDISQRARRDVHQIVVEHNYGDYLTTRWKSADRRWIEKQIL